MTDGSTERGGVVVTGGGGGIGAAVAARFGRAGYGVVVSDVGVDVAGDHPSPTAADAVVEQMTAAGSQAVAHHGSVTDFAVAEEVMQLAVARYGSLAALVTCHGILRERMVFNMSEDEWDSVVDVHLKGTFACFRFATSLMRAQRSGSLVALGSAAGMEGNPAQANYAAAKAGIVALVYSTALAMGRYGVNANCIIPSAATRMTARLTEATAGTRPAGERQGPELIAEVALALCQPACRAVTGQSITAAGRRVAAWSHPAEGASVELPEGCDAAEAESIIADGLSMEPLRRFTALGLEMPGGPTLSHPGADANHGG